MSIDSKEYKIYLKGYPWTVLGPFARWRLHNTTDSKWGAEEDARYWSNLGFKVKVVCCIFNPEERTKKLKQSIQDNIEWIECNP